MHSELEIEVAREGRRATVTLRGSADMKSTAQLRQQLHRLLEQGVREILVDISRLDFLCSESLGVLIDLHRRAGQQNGKLLLINPRPAINQLLATTNLTKLFRIFPDIEQAIASLV